MAVNCVGEAETTASVTLLQTSPSFGKKLQRNEDVDEGEPLELKAKILGSPKPTVINPFLLKLEIYYCFFIGCLV